MLAPMLGVSDIPFRALCREFGAVHACTEMASAKGIVQGRKEAFRHAVIDPDEGATSLQLVAAEPEYAALAARHLTALRPAVFDINCGCPNDNICAAGAGSKLLEDLDTLTSIVSAVKEAVSIPVSVKLRIPSTGDEIAVRRSVRAAEAGGASFIIMHGRMRATSYDSPARLDAIAAAKDEASVPVVGNGDVFCSEDAYGMMERTGCDAVMVARGALGTPWIFRDIALGRRCGILEYAPSSAELRGPVIRHLRMIQNEYGPILAPPHMRKHAMLYGRNYSGVGILRNGIFLRDDPEAVIEAVDRFFSSAPPLLDVDLEERKSMEAAFRSRVLYWTAGPSAYEAESNDIRGLG